MTLCSPKIHFRPKNKYMKNCILFIIVFCITLNIYSNNHLSGIVVNEENIPIPFASVYYKSSGGCITNSEGKFRIEKKIGDTLVFSCLGYERKEILLSQAELKDTLIILKRAVYAIDEVIVSPINAKAIVKKAIKNIPLNYPPKTTKISGTYKQVSMNNEKYTGLFESNLDIFITSMISKRKPKIETKLKNYELFKSPQNFNLAQPNQQVSRFWLYRHPFIDKFNKFKYTYDHKIDFNGKTLLKIKFSPLQIKENRFQYEGYMYINNDSYAFEYLEYSLIPNQYGFYKYAGRMQRLNQVSTKIMYSKQDFFYSVDYAIITSNITLEHNKLGTYFNLFSMFNFFTEKSEYYIESYEPDTLSLHDIVYSTKGKSINSQNYSTEFLLETSEEKAIKSQFGN